MQSVLMEQKLDEKMQHILNNCIQHHQVILRSDWTKSYIVCLILRKDYCCYDNSIATYS
jgi:hypothetical protein